MRIVILDRICLDDLSLRHNGCDLFRQSFEEVKRVEVKDGCQTVNSAHADAAGGCGRAIGDQFWASATSLIEKPKAILGPHNLLQTHSRACFIVGVRDATLPISFSSAT